MIRTYAPEWSTSELITVAVCSLSGRISHGPHIKRLEQKLSLLVGDRPIVATETGRGGLYAILERIKQVSLGHEVIIPSLVCEVAVFPILKAGLEPVFVDCRDDMTMDAAAVDNAVTKDTCAILMPHIYGKLCRIDELVEIAEAHDICLIDDAAQVVGARYKECAVGTFGRYGLFSFNYKQLCCPMGGAIVINEDDDGVIRDMVEAAGRSSAKNELKAGIYMGLKSLMWRKTASKALHEKKIRNGTAHRPCVEAMKIGPISNMCSAIALRQIKSLEQRGKQKIQQAQYLRKIMADNPVIRVMTAENGDLYTRLVVFVEGADETDPAQRLIEHALPEVEFQRIYEPFHLRVNPSIHLPRSEYLYRHCVVVPNHDMLTHSDIDRIIGKLNTFSKQQDDDYKT